MKKTFLLFLLISANLFSQSKLTGVVYYESGISQQNIDHYFSKVRSTLKKKEQIKFADDFFLKSKKVESTLRFSLKEAIYEVKKKLNLKERGSIIEKTNLISAGGLNIYYQNTSDKNLEIQNCTTLGECFIIISENNNKWQLTQETKKIAGYLCYKATTVQVKNNKKVNVIAWYVPNIPVSFGPKEYYGLPGLVIRVEESAITYNAVNIVLNSKEKIKINEPKKGIKISEDEFKANLNKSFDRITKKKN